MEKYQIDKIFSKVHSIADYNGIFCTKVCVYINRDDMYFVIMGCDYVMHFVPYKDILDNYTAMIPSLTLKLVL